MTIGALLDQAATRLAASGIDSPRREARLLVGLAAGLDDAAVLGYPERSLAPDAARRLEALVARRAAREPYSRLAGRREFWSLEFALSADTLDPRPDSECLVAAALARLPDRGAELRIVDFGTGSGCLLLALLHELPRAIGFGLDIAPGAVATARQNAAAMGLKNRAFFAVSGWGAALAGGFDIVITNPPYIPAAVITALAPEVALHDPRRALDGGPDGLAAFRALAPDIAGLLRPAGFACIEIGDGQAGAAAAIFATAGLDEIGREPDLSGRERCLVVARGG